MARVQNLHGSDSHSSDSHSTAPNRAQRIAGVAGLTLAAILALSACTSEAPAPSASPGTGESTPSTTPAPPAVMDPEGDAAANLPYFDQLATTLFAATPDADGRTIVDTLVAGGFVKTDMEVTFDRTNVDLAVDTLQFAVRWKGECILGQTGPASGGYHSMVAPMLATGTCLVGATRPIDW